MRIAAQVLDSTYGQFAAGVRARLDRIGEHGWATVARADTNVGGRIDDWDGQQLDYGLYRIVFDSGGYFSGLGTSSAYPEVVVTFRAQRDAGSCQVHVTLSPYSYSAHFEPWAARP